MIERITDDRPQTIKGEPFAEEVPTPPSLRTSVKSTSLESESPVLLTGPMFEAGLIRMSSTVGVKPHHTLVFDLRINLAIMSAYLQKFRWTMPVRVNGSLPAVFLKAIVRSPSSGESFMASAKVIPMELLSWDRILHVELHAGIPDLDFLINVAPSFVSVPELALLISGEPGNNLLSSLLSVFEIGVPITELPKQPHTEPYENGN